MHDLIKAELGDPYMLSLCPAHKIELAIRDAFEQSELNNSCNDDYTNIYYLFKKSNLRWRLLKRPAQFQGINYIRYKRSSGTRWVKHQCAALQSHLHNLPIFIGFCNSQIIDPHNAQIKKIKAKLDSYKNDVSQTKRLLFEAIKLDILNIVVPISKSKQYSTLLLPQLISSFRKVLGTLGKLNTLLLRSGK